MKTFVQTYVCLYELNRYVYGWLCTLLEDILTKSATNFSRAKRCSSCLTKSWSWTRVTASTTGPHPVHRSTLNVGNINTMTIAFPDYLAALGYHIPARRTVPDFLVSIGLKSTPATPTPSTNDLVDLEAAASDEGVPSILMVFCVTNELYSVALCFDFIKRLFLIAREISLSIFICAGRILTATELEAAYQSSEFHRQAMVMCQLYFSSRIPSTCVAPYLLLISDAIVCSHWPCSITSSRGSSRLAAVTKCTLITAGA